MATKSSLKKLKRTESICIGAGFLLKKLQSRFGDEFGEGMRRQVRDCIRECDAIGRVAQQREAAGKAATERAAGVAP